MKKCAARSKPKKPKPSFQIDGKILKLVDETAKKIGISRSDFVRMAINEKLYRLGVLEPEGIVAREKSSPHTSVKGGA